MHQLLEAIILKYKSGGEYFSQFRGEAVCVIILISPDRFSLSRIRLT